MLKTMIAPLAAVALFATAAPAPADEGPWRVGQTQVVRADGLDLARAEDRQLLLAAIETGAKRACRNVRTRAARGACEAEAFEAALARAPQARDAAKLAQAERAGMRVALDR